jgi:alkylhydroperoxidase/carboxymuconolactone decarboxylase family protein YurZ
MVRSCPSGNPKRKEKEMANSIGETVAPVEEGSAGGKVKEIFEEIKSTLKVSEVPAIFRVMAHIPEYLETSWKRYRFALLKDGALDMRTKAMLSLAVSATNNNQHMVLENTDRLKAMGVSDGEIAELMAVVDLTNGLNKVLRAAQVKPGT